MFKHLLVPVDDSDLSIVNVGEAIKLADGAMVAVPPPAAAGTGERVVDEGRALLAKAAAAAQAAGVPHATHETHGDKPAEAIAKAARHCGCDGIVMSSHRRSGVGALLTPSVATKVMRLS
ncbi:MAG: universal stress protein [Burkholderiaceae bacterium]|nr:universal stress protein [Burkholderiaceae bacterium]